MFPWQIPVIILVHLLAGYVCRNIWDKYPKREMLMALTCYIGVVWIGAAGVILAMTNSFLRETIFVGEWKFFIFGISQCLLFGAGAWHKEIIRKFQPNSLAINPT